MADSLPESACTMRVLIGYSACPLTREAFRKRGHDAWTCDLLPARDGSPFHLQCDIWNIASEAWDMGIFHPMCTYLTCSAAWAFADPDYDRFPSSGYHQKVKPGTLVGAARRSARDTAIENFRRLLALPYPKAIENPAPSFVSRAVRPPDQTVQPYQFGDPASKRTGLWLDRLPPLRPTGYVQPRMICRECGGRADYADAFKHGCAHCGAEAGCLAPRWPNQTDSGQNRLSPGEGRWLERSATYPGIANAMGNQWGT